MRRALRIILYTLAFFSLVFLLVYCSVKSYTGKRFAEAQREKPFDVVVVPGVPFLNPSTSKVLALRIFWAKHLYDRGYTRNIIFSGSSVYTPYVEGIIMKLFADSLGIPSEHTFSETRAEHSTENAYYGWKLARSMGFKKIALATDPFQSRSLESFIEKYCPGMKAIPAVRSELDLDSLRLPSIDSTPAFVPQFVPLTAREGFWTRFRGTLGRRVKEEVERDSVHRN